MWRTNSGILVLSSKEQRTRIVGRTKPQTRRHRVGHSGRRQRSYVPKLKGGFFALTELRSEVVVGSAACHVRQGFDCCVWPSIS